MNAFYTLRKLHILLILSAFALQGCALTTARKKVPAPRPQATEHDMASRTTEAILKGTQQP